MSLVRCNVGPTSVQLLETLREREIEHLNLDGNDLGLPEYESEVIEPLADYLKFNKFLLSLNLSFNNLSVETVTSLIDALCESDTVLRPDDLPQEEEEEIPIEQLLDEAEAEEGEPSEEEEEELEVDEEGEPEETQEEGEAEEEEAEEKEEKSEEESDDEDAEEKLQEQARLAQEKLDKQYARLFRSLMKEEAKARKASEREYRHATAKVADYLTVIRAQKQADKEKKIAEFCARRSGWSRLQYVLLRGNNVGDRGAASLARLLQNTVDLNEDEVNQIDEQLREKINQLIAQLVEERGKTRLSEAKEWQSIQKEHAAVTDKAESGKDEEEDEYAKDAPQVVFSNIEGGESDEEGNEPDSPLIEAELEGIDCSGWSLDIHPIKSGMNSIVYLDLGSCGVGSKGLTALSETLQANKVLTTLILRNNRFNTKFTKTKNEDGEVEQKEATDYVSPGFASLVKALGVNGTLAHLDLGYCNLQGSAVQLLASSLSGNSSLVTLCLEGNRLLASPPPDPTAESGSCLKNLLESITQSGIQHLNLSSMDLHEMLWQDESELLALLCQQLTSLYLNNTGISGGQLNRVYLSATESFTLQVLHLSRNQFVSEDDGQGVGLFLSQCVELSELCLDDHPKLSSRAVHEMFQNAPNCLSRLSCNRVGLSSAFVDSRPVFSADVLGNLSYLSLSDIDISSEAQLREWSDCIRSASSRLNVLSLWSRKINMEECLGTCIPLVNGLATLLYADFGVLLRFDGGQDISDTLGQMELTLTQRRLSLNTM
ncbi:Leucine Rich repeat, putative [Angomonas deanei]|uniref:Leucine Rich repeat, putative n=1 Tax=Angomonas deanei TaxID=59799 RepID=A0A7G2CA16_9TRYP|nr:Leucine Rich repeat, putative [Angomonas deanei]